MAMCTKWENVIKTIQHSTSKKIIASLFYQEGNATVTYTYVITGNSCHINDKTTCSSGTRRHIPKVLYSDCRVSEGNIFAGRE